MPVLPNSQRLSWVSFLQYRMPVLCSQADYSHRSAYDLRTQEARTQTGSAGRLAPVWSQGRPDKGLVQKSMAAYPGHTLGVRKPENYETQLSWQEVRHGLDRNLI